MNTPPYASSRVIVFCRAFLYLIAGIVPSARREEWRAEWNAELWELWHRAERVPNRYPHVTWRMLTFTAGAFRHAVAELRQEWRAELLWYELRHALRFLRRNRAFSVTSTLLIALGVGANSTVFTLVNAVLLRAPRGVEAPADLVQIGRGGADSRDFDSWSYPLFTDLRNRNKSFTELGAYAGTTVTVGREDDLATANAQLVTPNYFHLLGATIARGRAFLEEEDETGRASVVIISDGLWRRRFASDERVVGQSLIIRGRPFHIVGVARPEFTGADMGAPPPDLWLPIAAQPLVGSGKYEELGSRFISWVWIVGRLRPGVSAAAAQSDLSSAYRQIQLDLDGTVRDGVAVVPGLGLRPEERAVANAISGALLAIVGAVLLIACANLAALLLARGAARQTEISIRMAIGASRGRVVRQLAFETLIISVVGSAAAFLSTRWTAHLVEALMPNPVSVSLQPDVRVLAFALLLGIGTSAAFGALPAWRSAGVDLLSLLRGGAAGITNGGTRVRAAMLVGQIALSFTLLGSTGLLVRTILRANTLNPGFRTEDILVGSVDLHSGGGRSAAELSTGGFGTLSAPAAEKGAAAVNPSASASAFATATASANALRLAQWERLVARISAESGVRGATLASAVPATGTMSSRTMWPADGDMGDGRVVTVSTLVVDTGYFHVMGVPIVRGRQFDATADVPGRVTGLIINETFAKRVWPGQDPVGKRLAYGLLEGEQLVPVIGVVRDAKNRSLRADPSPQAYLLLSQSPATQLMLHVRVTSRDVATTDGLAQAIREVAPGTPPVLFEPIRAHLARGISDIRLIGVLGAVFGLLALALATVGIYGVMSYETARRTREYGVRLALGARPGAIHATVLMRSAKLGAAGIAIGLVATLALGPVLKRWVFGIAPFDPFTLAVVALILVATNAAAALGPAFRASRTDPMSSLRAD